MTDNNKGYKDNKSNEDTHVIAQKAKRKLAAREHGERGAWFGLSVFGLVGWAIAVPTVAGAFLGMWIDSWTTSTRSWTLALLLAGITVGCMNAWYWVQRESNDE